MNVCVKTVAGTLVVLAFAGAPRVEAQSPLAERFTVETVVNADRYDATDAPRPAGFGIDAFLSYRFTRRIELVAQPLVRRLPTGAWIHRTYQLALRVQTGGPVPARIEVGQIMSPIGAGTLQYRADMNPTLGFPAMYHLGLPAVEPGAPRLDMISPGYPLGALVSMSHRRFDARGAVLDTSPVRYRKALAGPQPPRSGQLMIGAGYTLRPGFRVGGSLARGRWAKAEEFISRPDASDRQATLAGVEWDFSHRYTRITGEWLRHALDTDDRPAVINGWSLQATQTLTPRWYAAARIDRVSAPRAISGRREMLHFGVVETVAGYRINPEISLRAGHVARHGFTARTWDHQLGVSIVWTRRWW